MARQANASYEGQGQRQAKQITALDIYPVGSIYLSVSENNPSGLFGGTWELLAPGRTLVCVDTGQEAFNTPEKTGGAYGNDYTHTHGTQSHVLTENEMPSHSHTISSIDGPIYWGSGTFDFWSGTNHYVSRNGERHYPNDWNGATQAGRVATTLTISPASTGANWGHSHGDTYGATQYISALQPYMTCYMWKRTA